MSAVTCVLLHGAGGGAWIWQSVVKQMTTRAVALEVPSRQTGVTPDGCAATLVEQLDHQGVDRVVLVVHSLSGVLVSGMATRLRSRLQRCVYLSAVVPPPGGSFIDAFGLVNRIVLRLLFQFNANGLKPSPSMIQKELCNDLDAETTALVVSRYTAEFPGLYLTRTTALPTLSTTYVKLMKDHSITPTQQDSMIARLIDPRVREVNAGHLAMLSAPEQLATIFDEEAAQRHTKLQS